MQSLWMVLASLLFACMGVCVKLAATTHSAVEITFYRSFISLILMFLLVRLHNVPLATPHWRWQISRGVVGFSALFAYFLAITLLPLATAVTLNYTSAIFLAIYLALAGMRLRAGILGALLVGLIDTLGKSLMPDLMRLFLDASAARQTGAALASMLVYIAMAAILAFRPAGLFPVRA